MNFRFLLLLAAALILAGCTKSAKTGETPNNQPPPNEQVPPARDIYTCPMHPSVVSDKPGACPVCNMALVKKHVEPSDTTPTDAAAKKLSAVSLSPVQRVMANVATITAEEGSASGLIQAVGTVEPADPLVKTVAARFGGRLERLYVNTTGVTVRKGQPLFDLYSPDLSTAIEELRIASRSLTDSNSAIDDSPARILAASKERLRERFGLADEQIRELANSDKPGPSVTFRSPANGTVTINDVKQGRYVAEGMQLYQVTDLSRVWVMLDVYEQDAARVKLQQDVEIHPDAAPSTTLHGTVAFIQPVVEAQTRTARVRVEIANAAVMLKPNMFVNAVIRSASRAGIRVPAEAVLYTGKRNIVWIETAANQYEPREVTVGETEDGMTEVVSGLQPGETLVASGAYLIESEAQLRAATSVR